MADVVAVEVGRGVDRSCVRAGVVDAAGAAADLVAAGAAAELAAAGLDGAEVLPVDEPRPWAEVP